ncbi:MAG: hypothetical protein CME62_11475 [Halobacteriovoraceae bacterium]|nr:hypothetical protein [Halobacteriovoraceae bacterium]|tara:strand:+ start:9797 stop:11224 length:1428 start_codon:yes stop_codon:yes gene_type:complete
MIRIIAYLLFISTNAWSQNNLDDIEKTIEKDRNLTNLSNTAKAISLNDAIEEGLRKNNAELLRKYQRQINELNFKDAFEDFYFPKLNLTMQTTDDHFVENIYRDDIENAESSKTPQGFIGLEMPDYTLFNWGKDFLNYLNEKEIYKRNKQIFVEQRRELRFRIITNYFNLSRLRNISRVYKKQLSHTSFIYKLAKEKLGLRKINSQEYLQAKAEFLKAHKNYQASLFAYYSQQQELADIMGDNPETVYTTTDSLKFNPLVLGAAEAQKLIAQNSPQVRDARTSLENANRTYQRVLKDNLPLPKFSLKLGSYRKTFSQDGVQDNFETFDGSRNLEVAATVNMTWTIFGSGGFFNSRVTERSYYQKRMAEINLKEAYRDTRVANQLTNSRINYLEKQFNATEAQLKNARKVFDYAIDNYIDSKTGFAELKLVLDEIQDAGISLENVKYDHLVEKITYASVLGIDDFPGEKFENLVEK